MFIKGDLSLVFSVFVWFCYHGNAKLIKSAVKLPFSSISSFVTIFFLSGNIVNSQYCFSFRYVFSIFEGIYVGLVFALP